MGQYSMGNKLATALAISLPHLRNVRELNLKVLAQCGRGIAVWYAWCGFDTNMVRYSMELRAFTLSCY